MESKQKKVKKYLTELKELPEEIKEDDRPDFKPKVQEIANKPRVEQPVVAHTPQPTKVEQENKTEEPFLSKEEPDQDFIVDDDLIEKPYTSKDIILGVINLISIVFLIFLLVKLPQKAEELKLLRVENVKFSDINASSVLNSEESLKKSDELKKLFLDDFGVYDFTVEIEKLKSTNSAVKRVSFTSQKPIKDKLGLFGIPAVIVLEGDWESIGNAMNAIESLPYLFRPISIKTDLNKDDPNVIILNYGGLLYVGEQFTKN